jgi:hypothetical protein
LEPKVSPVPRIQQKMKQDEGWNCPKEKGHGEEFRPLLLELSSRVG